MKTLTHTHTHLISSTPSTHTERERCVKRMPGRRDYLGRMIPRIYIYTYKAKQASSSSRNTRESLARNVEATREGSKKSSPIRLYS